MSRGTLWIGDIEPYMDDAFLKQAFAVMGETCLSTKIITNKLTGLPLGYGFLEFIDEHTAQRILLKCDGKPIPRSNPSKKFKLNHACHSKDAAQQLTLDAILDSTSADMVLDESGKSRGYGFVRFGDQEEHQQALEVMNGFEGLGSKALRVSSATPKSKSNVPTTVSMATPPGQQTYQQYYGNYGYNYQNYYNPWQGYQQYYAGYQGYQGYPGYYGQQPEYPQHTDASAVTPTGYEDTANSAAATAVAVPHGPNPPLPQAAPPPAPESDNEVEDHDMGMPDVEACNKLLLARSEDLYSAFDSSRWLPTEGLDPPLVSVK